MPGIGQVPGDRRCHRADGAGQGEQGDVLLAQPQVAGQLQRCRRPEQAEAGEHQALVQRPATQDRVAAQQLHERGQQLAVAGAVSGRMARNGGGDHQADQQHQAGSHQVHRAPAELAGHQAGQRPGQQDAQQQAAHDVADHAAAAGLRRQVGRQRDQHLHRHRAQADQQRQAEEQAGLGGERGRQQAEQGGGGGDQHQPAAFQQVGQRHQEQQAEGIADLRQRDDQAGPFGVEADIRGDQLDDRLCVVEVGDDGAAAQGEQQHQCLRQGWGLACERGGLAGHALFSVAMGGRRKSRGPAGYGESTVRATVRCVACNAAQPCSRPCRNALKAAIRLEPRWFGRYSRWMVPS